MVSKDIKKTILVTIDETFKKMNSVAWIERQKAMKDEAFKNAEKLLYSYETLKEYLEDEQEYIDIALHAKSKSIVVYSSTGGGQRDEDEILKDRRAQYERTKADLKRIEKALKKIEGRKGYEVIEWRYLRRKEIKEGDRVTEEVYTYEEITEMLAGKDGYSENLNEKTVRNYKNTLVREIAVLLFGSDAI